MSFPPALVGLSPDRMVPRTVAFAVVMALVYRLILPSATSAGGARPVLDEQRAMASAGRLDWAATLRFLPENLLVQAG